MWCWQRQSTTVLRCFASLHPSLGVLLNRLARILASDFRERAALLALGPVVLVSSDSPTAPVMEIREKLGWLKSPGRVLLGPCADGGYYLIGLSEFHPELFRGIAWSTGEVLAQTRGRCRELSLETVELTEALDVDEVEDLRALSVELEHDPQKAPRTRKFLRSL